MTSKFRKFTVQISRRFSREDNPKDGFNTIDGAEGLMSEEKSEMEEAYLSVEVIRDKEENENGTGFLVRQCLTFDLWS
ncbi:unnamed protein product [Taenia asiatica]|uniref:Uncharacterized protein n=1 Tax=Taenia asiatica TaxID=60517 RepID=A0A0R3VVQ7_TAEAS|nr:unnamed protein product [Taenia asiatica]